MPDRENDPIAPGTAMSAIFERMHQALLILGEPGVGKTTILLELACDMIERAEDDLREPIPVVLNLSSWGEGELSIAEWVVDELRTKYFIPEGVCRLWVEQEALLLLLDGLDEVRSERQAACVEAINAFCQEHGLTPLAVCSRLADYEALPCRLRLQGAILLQPLTPEQTEEYLAQAGDQLLAVRRTLQHDAALSELARTPLMLSVIALAYRGMSVQELGTYDTVEARREHVFAAYVNRMFKRRKTDGGHFSQDQTFRWLSWLARRMIEHGQSVFLIERMRPDWLPGRLQRWVVTGGVSVLCGWAGVIGGLLFGGLGGWLLGGMDWPSGALSGMFRRTPRSGSLVELIAMLSGTLFGELGMPLFFGLFYGLVGGLVFGLFGGLNYGGRACIQHLALRFLLWRNGFAPLNYARFLDYAAARILLRKVGGGYIFVHGILQEWFADRLVSQEPQESHRDAQAPGEGRTE